MQSGQKERTKTKQHVHKLKRLSYSTGNKIYFCVLPDCPYKVKVALALGKRTICWRCSESFIMNEYSIRLAKPHCENCHQSKSGDFVLHNNILEEQKKELRDENWTIDKELTLTERLKKASQINHTKIEDEGEL